MREVVVTVGPRAAGKSTFCEGVIALDPSIVEVSRDKMLLELFGTTSMDPYAGHHIIIHDRMTKVVEGLLGLGGLRMILDTWNGNQGERRAIIRKLREQGFDKVTAWYFTTPVEVVEEWFWKKPGIAKMDEMRSRQGEGLVFYLEDAPRRDHATFHRLASSIDSDGFDEVIKINPLVTAPECMLALQSILEV